MSRRQLLAWLASGVLAGGAGYGLWHYASRVAPRHLRVEKIEVAIPRLAEALEGLSIVQLSDLHLYPFTQLEDIQAAVELANSLTADLVCLTGDYVLSDINAIFDLAPVIANLEATLGRFAVYGNHDLWFSRSREIVRAAFQRADIVLLDNDGVSVQVGQSQLFVAGLDDALKGRPNLDKSLAKRPDGVTTILLVHEPDVADEVRRQAPVDLQLSGHSHGGQVRLPGMGALVLPRLGQKYDMGLYQLGGMQLYTNRGIGVVGSHPLTGVRFNCPPEVSHITLKRA